MFLPDGWKHGEHKKGSASCGAFLFYTPRNSAKKNCLHLVNHAGAGFCMAEWGLDTAVAPATSIGDFHENHLQ